MERASRLSGRLANDVDMNCSGNRGNSGSHVVVPALVERGPPVPGALACSTWQWDGQRGGKVVKGVTVNIILM